MNGPGVCVIMPAYNAGRFIEEAIRSVMGQTYRNWELLVIDDGSKDDTVEVVRRLCEEDDRITLLCNPENMGVARTRNRGLELCSGRYAALLDSDDVWHPEKLEKQLMLAENTGAQLLYTSYAIMDEQGLPARGDYVIPYKTDFSALLKENVIGCSTVMLSPELAEKYRFEINYHHEDYVLWLQILRDGYPAAGCTEVLTRWRYIANSRSFDKRRSAKSRWRIYREYLKLSVLKSAWAFGGYALASLKKYGRKAKPTKEGAFDHGEAPCCPSTGDVPTSGGVGQSL